MATPDVSQQIINSYPDGMASAGSVTKLMPGERPNAIVGSWDSIFGPSYRFAGFTPDLLTTQKGYDLYRDMLTTSACRAPFNVKRYAVLYKGWEVLPAVSDPKEPDFEAAKGLADAVTYAFNNIVDEGDLVQDFRSVLFETLRACWDGFSVSEILWRVQDEGPYAGKMGFRRFANKPCKQIGFDLDHQTLAVRNITSYTPADGYDFSIPIEKCILYTYNPMFGLPYGDGDARANYKHWWSLDTLSKFWNIALQKFGAPFIMAKVPFGNVTLREQCLAALDAIAMGSSAALPNDVEYEVQQLATGATEGFLNAINYHTQQCAYNILLQTLTTGEGDRVGSMALGNVHQDTQEYALAFVRRDLEGIIERQVIRRFVRYNYGQEALALCPKFFLGDWDGEDILALAQALGLMLDKGVLFRTEKVIRERMGLPPIDPESEKLMEQERQQQQKMQEKQLAAKSDGMPGSGFNKQRAVSTAPERQPGNPADER